MEDCLKLSRAMKLLDLSGNQIGDEGVDLVLGSLQGKKKLCLHTLSL